MGIVASTAGHVRHDATMRVRIDVGGADISSRSRHVACNSPVPHP